MNRLTRLKLFLSWIFITVVTSSKNIVLRKRHLKFYPNVPKRPSTLCQLLNNSKSICRIFFKFLDINSKVIYFMKRKIPRNLGLKYNIKTKKAPYFNNLVIFFINVYSNYTYMGSIAGSSLRSKIKF